MKTRQVIVYYNPTTNEQLGVYLPDSNFSEGELRKACESLTQPLAEFVLESVR